MGGMIMAEKILINPFPIETTENELRKLLLSRLGDRSCDIAMDLEEQKDKVGEAVEFLFEINNIFHFVVSSLEEHENYLEKIRCEAEQKQYLSEHGKTQARVA
jgi:hypothetical protein